jgi:hypothetical protein
LRGIIRQSGLPPLHLRVMFEISIVSQRT